MSAPRTLCPTSRNHRDVQAYTDASAVRASLEQLPRTLRMGIARAVNPAVRGAAMGLTPPPPSPLPLPSHRPPPGPQDMAAAADVAGMVAQCAALTTPGAGAGTSLAHATGVGGSRSEPLQLARDAARVWLQLAATEEVGARVHALADQLQAALGAAAGSQGAEGIGGAGVWSDAAGRLRGQLHAAVDVARGDGLVLSAEVRGVWGWGAVLPASAGALPHALSPIGRRPATMWQWCSGHARRPNAYMQRCGLEPRAWRSPAALAVQPVAALPACWTRSRHPGRPRCACSLRRQPWVRPTFDTSGGGGGRGIRVAGRVLWNHRGLRRCGRGRGHGCGSAVGSS
jgi:hypothetical protein